MINKKVGHFRLILLEIWSLVYHGITSGWKWFYQSWLAGWNIIFGVFTLFLTVLFSRQAWVIILIIIVVFLVILGPSTVQQAFPQINEWKVATVSDSDLEIFFYHPRYVAGDDYGYFEVSIQNATDETMHNVAVGIRSPEGLIIFDKDNLIVTEKLLPGAIVTEKLPFHIVQPIGDTCITTTVISVFNMEGRQEQRQVWQQNTPTLCPSLWRVPVVVSRKLPDAMQTIATYIGVISSMLAGIVLLFREQLHPLFQKIWVIIKRSG